VTVALYSTIWISLALFVAAQHGYRSWRTPQWVQTANAAGLALCVIHIGLAMGSVHGWSHASAIDATAVQTASVYGVRWGGGVFVNYLFVIVWALEAWWRTGANRSAVASRAARWGLRTFYAIVVVNAAVVFARGSMRVAGAVLVVALLLAWRPHARPTHGVAAAL
jgi:hypothetical protein